jgi:hypothetical protein
MGNMGCMTWLGPGWWSGAEPSAATFVAGIVDTIGAAVSTIGIAASTTEAVASKRPIEGTAGHTAAELERIAENTASRLERTIGRTAEPVKSTAAMAAEHTSAVVRLATQTEESIRNTERIMVAELGHIGTIIGMGIELATCTVADTEGTIDSTAVAFTSGTAAGNRFAIAACKPSGG